MSSHALPPTPTPTPTIASTLAAHQPTTRNAGSFLTYCTCGTAVDYYPLHQQEAILRDCFPHLAALHLSIITEPDKVFPADTHAALSTRNRTYEALLDNIYTLADTPVAFDVSDPSSRRYAQGFHDANARIRALLDDADL